MNIEEKIFDVFPIDLPKRYLKSFDYNSWNINMKKISCNNDENIFRCFSNLVKIAVFSKMKCMEDKLNIMSYHSYYCSKIDIKPSDFFFNVLANMSNFYHSVDKNINKINFKSHNVYNQINQFLYDHLFKYDVPNCFYSFWGIRSNQGDLFTKILSVSNGASTRTIFNLSKNENKYFYESNYPFDNENEFISYLIARANNCNINLSINIAKNIYSRLNTGSISNDVKKMMLIRRISNWFSHQYFFNYNHISDILDYIFSRNDPYEFNLNGRNINSMLRLCEEWHNELNLKKIRYENKTWDNIGFSKSINEVEFVELNSSIELKKEGNRQHNCVYSYENRCASGHTAIVSMRGQGRVTIEINLDKNAIVQIKEKYNKTVSKENFKIIKQYAEEQNLKIDNDI